MKTSSLMIRLLACSVLVLAPSSWAQKRPPILEQTAKTYGLDSFGQIEAITWELYVGKDKRVQEFIYIRGGPKPPHLITASWAGYKKAGPLLISTEHRGTADGKPLHIYLTDVAVKLKGSDTWIKAQ